MFDGIPHDIVRTILCHLSALSLNTVLVTCKEAHAYRHDIPLIRMWLEHQYDIPDRMVMAIRYPVESLAQNMLRALLVQHTDEELRAAVEAKMSVPHRPWTFDVLRIAIELHRSEALLHELLLFVLRAFPHGLKQSKLVQACITAGTMCCLHPVFSWSVIMNVLMVNTETRDTLITDSSWQWKPLHYACRHEREDMVRSLFSRYPDAANAWLNAPRCDESHVETWERPLYLACRYNAGSGVVRTLLDFGARIEHEHGTYNALHAAMGNRIGSLAPSKAVLDQLFRTHPSSSYQAVLNDQMRGRRWTPLHMLAANTAVVRDTFLYSLYAEKVSALIHRMVTHGANLNARTFEGKTPYMLCCETADSPSVRDDLRRVVVVDVPSPFMNNRMAGALFFDPFPIEISESENENDDES